MNSKIIGSSFLIAGTSIGAGMLALPLILAKFGLLYSLIIMFLVSLVVIFFSLINVELYLKSGKIGTLGAIADFYGGKIYAFIGHMCIFLLTFSLTSAYISGLGSTIGASLEIFHISSNQTYLMIIVTFIISVILLLQIKNIDIINRFLFISLIFILLIICVRLLMVSGINFDYILKTNSNILDYKMAILVIFTSFGFQIILPTISQICDFNKFDIIKSIIYGSLLTFGIYSIWVYSTISAIYSLAPESYNEILLGKIEIGEFLIILSKIANINYLAYIIKLVSILAITTSAIGIAMAQIQLIKAFFNKNEFSKVIILELFMTIIPSSLIAIFIPNAFIKALGFAGAILIVKVIILQSILLLKSGNHNIHIKICYNKLVIYSMIILSFYLLIQF